jgi:hypothetical protein
MADRLVIFEWLRRRINVIEQSVGAELHSSSQGT